MYLKNIKIWNFRKIGTKDNSNEIKSENPGIDVSFNPFLNVLIGENNSGKTAIIDAIRMVLGSHTFDFHRLDERDFHYYRTGRSRELRIECVLSGFSSQEAGFFLEWLHFNELKQYELRIWLYAYIRDNRVIYNVKAGIDDDGSFMDGAAKDMLRLTYLKPLRDAESELSPGYKSRLAQILSNDPLFKDQMDDDQQKIKHTLEKYVSKANNLITDYFSQDLLDENKEYEISNETPGGGPIKSKVENHLKDFFHIDDVQNPFFHISGSELASILKKLGLSLEENKSGLGALNKLFIATELLLLQGKNYSGLRLALVEELEAHLHPQAQLRVISALQNKQQEFDNQFILSTHSTTLASKLHLKNFILCQEGKAYSLASDHTALEQDDYEFLERFLDATQSNMFFAKGVILVEGTAENILIPTIAEIIGRPLHRYGVSVVNVGSKAFLRYSKIFRRFDESTLPIKVSIITDLDIEQTDIGGGTIQSKKRKVTRIVPDAKIESDNLINVFNSADGRIQVFHSPLWTMEHDLALGEFAEFINCATYLAQLSKSRSSNHNFKGISTKEAVKRIKKAKGIYSKWKEDNLSDEQIAYKIYERLSSNKASKTVTAQWLSKMLLRYKSKIEHGIKTDEKFKYIVDAIYNVTKPEDADH